MTPNTRLERNIIDLDRALNRTGGDEALLRELAEIFLQESTHWQSEVEKGVQTRDPKTVLRAAHDIKGSTDLFGAHVATETAKRLENMGRTEDLGGAAEALDELKIELTWVRSALQDYLDGGTA